MIVSFSPAGLEHYFFEAGQPYTGESPPPPSAEEIDRLMEAAPNYGIEFITGPDQVM